MAMFHHIFWIISMFHSSQAGVNITNIQVPPVRIVGEDAELECGYTRTPNDRVYSIKWWRDNDQFYQYIPENVPPILPFNVSGISVDGSKSSDQRVFLSHVTSETSGLFTCEVMADESFETVRVSSNLTVLDLPDGEVAGVMGPTIKVEGMRRIGSRPLAYEMGKTLDALCIAKKTYPKATLTWLINGKLVSKDFVTDFQTEQNSRFSFTSTIWITFIVNENLFNDVGELQLVCNCSLEDFFHSHDTLVLRNTFVTRALNSGLYSAGESWKGINALILTTLIFASMVSAYLTRKDHSPPSKKIMKLRGTFCSLIKASAICQR